MDLWDLGVGDPPCGMKYDLDFNGLLRYTLLMMRWMVVRSRASPNMGAA